MKVLRPLHGGFSCMHVKILVFDNRVILTGSVNLIHNGLEKNKEHLFRIEDPSTVQSVMEDFEKDWEQAEPVSEMLMAEMMNNHAARERKKEQDRVARNTRSRSMSASRSLSVELEEAAAVAEAQQ